ncbi:MAG: hypothetical protein KDA89_14880 [Planctomycetaceae bacterium]|nr:hypothetical protein [Planctomycetaceae bacterium]
MHEFTSSSVLPCTAAQLREYLGRPANLPQISDPDLELEVLSAPELVHVDAVIEFRISAYGFKQRMQHRLIHVSDLEIIAEQIEGPTRSWIHRQTIVSAADSTAGCTLTDHIQFETPGGMLGYLMTPERITESLEQGMAFRYDALKEIFG